MHIDDKTATESRSCSVAGEREGGGNETPDRVPPAARHPAENTWRHTERAVLVQERSSEWRVVPEFKPSTLHSSLLLFYGNSQENQRFCFTPKTVTSSDRRPPSRLRAKIWIRPHLVLIMFTLWNFNTSLMFQVLFFCVITQNDVREANLSSTNARAQKTAFPRTATWIREMH